MLAGWQLTGYLQPSKTTRRTCPCGAAAPCALYARNTNCTITRSCRYASRSCACSRQNSSSAAAGCSCSFEAGREFVTYISCLQRYLSQYLGDLKLMQTRNDDPVFPLRKEHVSVVPP